MLCQLIFGTGWILNQPLYQMTRNRETTPQLLTCASDGSECAIEATPTSVGVAKPDDVLAEPSQAGTASMPLNKESSNQNKTSKQLTGE